MAIADCCRNYSVEHHARDVITACNELILTGCEVLNFEMFYFMLSCFCMCTVWKAESLFLVLNGTFPLLGAKKGYFSIKSRLNPLNAASVYIRSIITSAVRPFQFNGTHDTSGG